MRDKTLPLAATVLAMTLGVAALSGAQTGDTGQTLSVRQQSIIPIAAFSASGDLERLEPALNQGLDNGLTVNEVKETLVQLYAYAGFPRSLNALHAFMDVMDARRAQGIEDETGP